MDMLTAAGIGPDNYAERAKVFKVIGYRHDSGMMYIGSHPPEEYDEFESCLTAAANFPDALEAAAVKLLDIANLAMMIEDCSGGERRIVGHGLQILALILMQAGCPLSQDMKSAFMKGCCMDHQVIYSTWGPVPANRRMLMRIFVSLVEHYDGLKAAIRYEPEGFANSLVRCKESDGESRKWQDERNAIMSRISVTQSSRTSFTHSQFNIEGCVQTHDGKDQPQEVQERNKQLTEEMGERSYTNKGDKEAFKNTSKGTPSSEAELTAQGLTPDVLAEPDEAAAAVAPVPGAAPAGRGDTLKTAQENMTEEKLVRPQHADSDSMCVLSVLSTNVGFASDSYSCCCRLSLCVDCVCARRRRLARTWTHWHMRLRRLEGWIHSRTNESKTRASCR
jgi:hypothetical protein